MKVIVRVFLLLLTCIGIMLQKPKQTVQIVHGVLNGSCAQRPPDVALQRKARFRLTRLAVLDAVRFVKHHAVPLHERRENH